MLLYHFTSRANFPLILRSGLSLGAVPVSPVRAVNAVWLTTDPGDFGHGLEAGGAFMTDDQRKQALDWSGTLPPPGARHAKDAQVRITVDLPPNARGLENWLPWARRHLAPEWLATLHPVASGNIRKAKTWRLFFGVIPAAEFVAVDALAEQPRPALREARA
jgi:hypothetical protein